MRCHYTAECSCTHHINDTNKQIRTCVLCLLIRTNGKIPLLRILIISSINSWFVVAITHLRHMHSSQHSIRDTIYGDPRTAAPSATLLLLLCTVHEITRFSRRKRSGPTASLPARLPQRCAVRSTGAPAQCKCTANAISQPHARVKRVRNSLLSQFQISSAAYITTIAT